MSITRKTTLRSVLRFIASLFRPNTTRNEVPASVSSVSPAAKPSARAVELDEYEMLSFHS